MVDLIGALQKRGVDCRVVVPREGHVARVLQKRHIPYVVSFFRLWCGPDVPPAWDRALKKPVAHVVRALRLAGMIRAWQCDVVVTNTLAMTEGALGARFLGLPHVTHVREFGDLDHGWKFEFGAHRSVRILSALSRRVIFNSRALAQHYESEVPVERARVVYNAVVVPPLSSGKHGTHRRSGAEDVFRCVFVGNITPSKGPEDSVRAVAEARRRGLRVHLKLVGGGPGPYLAYLRELITTLGIRAHVEMVGYAPDPYPFFQEADVALVCSRMEAFGRVTIEAMKMGTPVIGAATGGTPEAIQSGCNGLLYAPGDWRELADKIQDLYENPAETAEMGCRAREWSLKTFTEDRYAAEVAAVLSEAIACP